MKMTYKLLIILLLITKSVYANDVSNWLKSEIDIILNTYKNENLTKIERFAFVEDTINKNFAGTGIAKFVAGKSWSLANKENKEKYVKVFKRNLALNIASILEGYSDQTYSFTKVSEDNKNSVSIINMEITYNTNRIIVTWRVKKAKNRFFIIDLIVADISLVVTKRSEFNSMLKNLNYELSKLTELLETTNNNSYDKLIK